MLSCKIKMAHHPMAGHPNPSGPAFKVLLKRTSGDDGQPHDMADARRNHCSSMHVFHSVLLSLAIDLHSFIIRTSERRAYVLPFAQWQLDRRPSSSPGSSAQLHKRGNAWGQLKQSPVANSRVLHAYYSLRRLMNDGAQLGTWLVPR